jgi:hypothetical protein
LVSIIITQNIYICQDKPFSNDNRESGVFAKLAELVKYFIYLLGKTLYAMHRGVFQEDSKGAPPLPARPRRGGVVESTGKYKIYLKRFLFCGKINP